METYGADSFAGSYPAYCKAVVSDTSFYVIAAYFGAISVKNIWYAMGAMLLADLEGNITLLFLLWIKKSTGF